MGDADVRQCKLCQEYKVRIHRGKFDFRNKRFMDQKGGLWNGNVCPPCNRARVNAKMKELRERRKISNVNAEG